MSFIRDDSGLSVIKLIVIVAVLTACAAAAFFAYAYFQVDRGNTPKPLTQVALKTELITFTYQLMPELYAGVEGLNDRLLLIEQEIDRLNKLEGEFPRQKRIVSSEKNTWLRTQKELLNCLARLEKGIEKIYVAYRVNPETGMALIGSEQSDLLAEASLSLKTSDELCGRLVKEKPKSFWGKIKQKLNTLFQ